MIWNSWFWMKRIDSVSVVDVLLLILILILMHF